MHHDRTNPQRFRGRQQVGDREAQFSTDAVRVEDGKLKIKVYTTRHNGRNEHRVGWLETNPDTVNSNKNANIADDYEGLEKKFGYVEARIKFNKRRGMWGAFWLQSRANTSANARMFRNPTDFAATYGAEIDIVEAVSKHRPNNARDFLDYKDRLISNVHWNGYTKGSGPEHKRAALGIDEQKKKRQSSLHNQWHTYGLLWTEGAYEIYIDNTLMGTFDKGISHHPEYYKTHHPGRWWEICRRDPRLRVSERPDEDAGRLGSLVAETSVTKTRRVSEGTQRKPDASPLFASKLVTRSVSEGTQPNPEASFFSRHLKAGRKMGGRKIRAIFLPQSMPLTMETLCMRCSMRLAADFLLTIGETPKAFNIIAPRRAAHAGVSGH